MPPGLLAGEPQRAKRCVALAQVVRYGVLLVLALLVFFELLPAHTSSALLARVPVVHRAPPPDVPARASAQQLAVHQRVLAGHDQQRLQAERKEVLGRFAVALKTGGDVAAVRLPVLQHTWLGAFSNVLVIGDRQSEVGGLVVNDVLSGQDGLAKQKVGVDSASKIEDTDGWKNDALKNIPGFHQLHSKYPSADWYLMVDDDTYVYVDNLLHFVADKNPNDALYMGAGTKFVGCDGVTEYGQGPRFAHGGSGILLSRATMKAVFANGTAIEGCAKRYRTCMFGDVRVSLCLRDHGVHLTPFDVFNYKLPDDFTGGPRWPAIGPCMRPVSHHKMAPHQMLGLYQAEQHAAQLGQYVDMGYLRTLQLGAGASERNDTLWRATNHTLVGQPYASLLAATPADCARACEAAALCVGWVLDPDQRCHLHDHPRRELRPAAGHTCGRVYLCRAVLGEMHNVPRGHRWVYQMHTGTELVPPLWEH